VKFNSGMLALWNSRQAEKTKVSGPPAHRGGENFKKNHPNTGQKPSQINRNQAQQQKRKYWKDKANQQD